MPNNVHGRGLSAPTPTPPKHQGQVGGGRSRVNPWMRTSLTPRHTRLHEAHVKPRHPVSLRGEPPRAPGTAPQSAACTAPATPPSPQVSRPCSRPHPVAGDAVSPIRPPSGAPPRPGPESAVSRAPSRPRGQKPRGRSCVAIGEPRVAAWRSRVWRVSHVTCHRCTRPSPTPGPHAASCGGFFCLAAPCP